MSARGRLALMAAVAVVGGWAWATPADAHVYWVDLVDDSLGRANLDGTSADLDFIDGVNEPFGVAVDDRYIYWTNTLASTIGRANLDGSGVNQRFVTGANGPTGVAVDDQHIYWTNFNGNTIGRAKLDGSDAGHDFITGANHPGGIAIDGSHVYWANNQGHTIGRANLDGSDADQDFITGASSPTGMAVGDGFVYWTNVGLGSIGRANLDGTDADQGFFDHASSHEGAVAVDDRHLYWSDLITGTIGRANLDGSDADQDFITASGRSYAIALDGGPAGTASTSAAKLSFGSQQLGTLGAPKEVTITNDGHGNLEIDRARVDVGHVGDFLVSDDTCSRRTLTIGAACTIRVRFGPSASGARQATLALGSNDPAAPLRIALEGAGGEPLRGAPGGIGDKGSNGATGAIGPAGPQGWPRRVRLVTCRTVVVKRRGRTVKRRRCSTRVSRGSARFTITGTARATLTRRGKRYATGTARPDRVVLNARRRVPPGRYTLTLRYRNQQTTRVRITLR